MRLLKKVIIFFSLLLAQTSADSISRPKIGLVLSGGGARGFAHIGTLKLLDSLQIPIDYIVGTSMGGITAALYAIGYDGAELEKLVNKQDWEEIFTDTPSRDLLPFFEKKDAGKYQFEFDLKGLKPVTPSGLIRGQKVSLLFSRLTSSYEHVTNFDQLPIPFRCIAVDLITGRDVILKSGSLAKAMRSTMSIPSIFSPVEWGDSLLIDGGLLNNLPVDVVREMGADIIIAVNVGTSLKKRQDLQSILDILEQSVIIPENLRQEENIKQADILIIPQLEDLSRVDFNTENIKRIIHQGNIAAYKNINELIQLKETYQLKRTGYSSDYQGTEEKLIIHGVTISGNTTLPYIFVYQLLGISPMDIFDPDTLDAKLSRMRHSEYFETVEYEIKPVSGKYVRLLIHIKEKHKPFIYGISIKGNEILPYFFIYHLLGIKPLDIFDTDKLDRQITELYSLGYFETIHYEIEPVSEKSVRLILHVRERSLRKLRMGLHYESRYKLIAIIGLKGTDIVIPGLRMESDVQFAGLTRFRFKAFYPSRTLNFPVYPFLRVNYKDIPVNVFDIMGKKVASYHDRSTEFGVGIGFLPTKYLDLEVEYSLEHMNVEPEIAMAGIIQTTTDTIAFESWYDKLHKLQAAFHYDMLDDVFLPREGILIRADYEGSFKELGTDKEYKQVEISADLYRTFGRLHTGRIFALHCQSSGTLPIYKFFSYGGPESFIGVDYDQLFGDKMSILRFDYRYQYKPDLFLKLIVNTVLNYEYHFENFTYKPEPVWGYGISLTFLSTIGPLELIFSRGEESVFNPGNKKNNIYFTAGYQF